MKNRYRSNLSVAKNLGSAGLGSKHWWYQRFTAIILLLITAWVFHFFKEISSTDVNTIIGTIKKPYNLIMIILFVCVGLYHAVIGMQVVIEDYIHNRALKITLILITQIFSIITGLTFVMSVFYLMTL